MFYFNNLPVRGKIIRGPSEKHCYVELSARQQRRVKRHGSSKPWTFVRATANGGAVYSVKKA